MSRPPKAADIPDGLMLALVRQLAHSGGQTFTSAVVEAMPALPPKVVRAKLSILLRRGMLNGCDCGCYGGWELTDAGAAVLESV